MTANKVRYVLLSGLLAHTKKYVTNNALCYFYAASWWNLMIIFFGYNKAPLRQRNIRKKADFKAVFILGR